MAVLDGLKASEASHIVCKGGELIMEYAYTQKQNMATRGTGGKGGKGIVVQPQGITMHAPRVIPPRIPPPPPPRVTPSSAPGVYATPSSAPRPTPRPSSSSEPLEKKSRVELIPVKEEEVAIVEEVEVIDVTDVKEEVSDDTSLDGELYVDNDGAEFRVMYADEDRDLIIQSIEAGDFESVKSLMWAKESLRQTQENLRCQEEDDANDMSLTGVENEAETDIVTDDQWQIAAEHVDSPASQDVWSAEAEDGDLDHVHTPNPNERE